MADIGIIGYGIVGQATAFGFKDHNVKFYDKFKQSDCLEEVCKHAEFIFVCLPTPMTDKGINLSIMDDNIDKIAELVKGTPKIVIIKSTIVPGTTAKYAEKYPDVNFCFNPEFLREATYLEDFIEADRTIISSNKCSVSNRVTVLYKQQFPDIPVFRTDFTTAEMVKYMSNCLLATIVMYCNEIYDICDKLEINYNEAKNLVLKDRRFKNLDYFEVTTNRGFGGKCLPKDLVAMIGKAKELGVDITLLETVWQKNLKIRKHKDWEEIPFATS